MAKPRKNESRLVITALVWLKDEERFEVVEESDHTPRPGEILEIEEEGRLVVEWTERIECEWVVN